MNRPYWSWASYSDVGRVIELSAVYDDVLKKDDSFTNYAIRVANRICEDLMLNCEATYGKWERDLNHVKIGI